MKSKKNDRRVRYTKHMLRQSLLELLKTRSMQKITVKDICECADINRGTFYSHYSDPYDLLASIENELCEDILGSLEKAAETRDDNITDSYALIRDIVQCVYDNRDLCSILLGENFDGEFIKRIVAIVKEKLFSSFPNMSDTQRVEYMYIYIANGGVGILQKWVQDGMTVGVDEIAFIINALAGDGVTKLQSC